MPVLDLLRGVTKGLAEASGNDEAVQDIGQQQALTRQRNQNVLQQQIAPLAQAAQAGKNRLAMFADPNDPTKAVPGREADYAAAHDQLADVIGKMRNILHPPPADDPHGLGYLAARVGDKLHITSDLANSMQQDQAQKVGAYQDQTANQVKNAVQSIPYNPLTPDEVHEAARIKAGILPVAKVFRPVSPTADTRAREDFDNDTTKPDGETFESWKTRQSGIGRKANVTGLKYDPNTGQAIDLATGKRYNANDADTPPEVKQMMLGAGQMQSKKEQLQTRLAMLRGAAYNASKPMIVLDSANGNTPTVATFGEMQKTPGRFIPASEGDKAIAKENLMQDIAGTSQATRTAINHLRADFPVEMKAKIALAMKADDPHSALDSLMASGALGSLTPDQQDFLVSTRQLAENAMAMRSVLGAGQGSDDVRRAIQATLPSLLSPDRAFALKQLNAFDATLQRLHRGVNNVKLNETPMTGQANTVAPGQSKGTVSIAAAMKKPKYAGKSAKEVSDAIAAAGYTPVQ